MSQSNQFNITINPQATTALAAAVQTAVATPNKWVEVTHSSTFENFLADGSSKTCLTWANNPQWDDTGRRLYFTGGSHGDPVGRPSFFIYDEQSNQVSKTIQGVPWGEDPQGHGYTYAWLSVADRVYGWAVHRFNLTTQQWMSDIPTPPNTGRGYSSWHFHTGMNRLVCGFFVYNTYKMDVNNIAATTIPNSWVNIGSSPDCNTGVPNTNFDGQGMYNRTSGVMIFGGNFNPFVYAVRSNGAVTTVTKISNLPSNGTLNEKGPPTYISSEFCTKWAADPVSGKFLFFGNFGLTCHEWDPPSDNNPWTSVTSKLTVHNSRPGCNFDNSTQCNDNIAYFPLYSPHNCIGAFRYQYSNNVETVRMFVMRYQ